MCQILETILESLLETTCDFTSDFTYCLLQDTCNLCFGQLPVL